MENDAMPGQVILLVEDDSDIRDVMEAVLCEEGYTVCPAENGLRGLELARARSPALILLDLMMPVMTGWEFRVYQRAEPALANIPVIVVSAIPPGSVDVESLAAAAYIPKPFEFDVLVRTVEEHVASGPAA
jgi:CheY-like chemotaxis protein